LIPACPAAAPFRHITYAWSCISAASLQKRAGTTHMPLRPATSPPATAHGVDLLDAIELLQQMAFCCAPSIADMHGMVKTRSLWLGRRRWPFCSVQGVGRSCTPAGHVTRAHGGRVRCTRFPTTVYECGRRLLVGALWPCVPVRPSGSHW
jgi:hypothetical protein